MLAASGTAIVNDNVINVRKKDETDRQTDCCFTLTAANVIISSHLILHCYQHFDHTRNVRY